ncbi:hypothetical protein ACXWR7_12360, partial [Streptococcus pyogenes]
EEELGLSLGLTGVCPHFPLPFSAWFSSPFFFPSFVSFSPFFLSSSSFPFLLFSLLSSLFFLLSSFSFLPSLPSPLPFFFSV